VTARGGDELPAVHDTGDGPAVLMLHAFPLDASQWDHQVAALSGAHRCLRPDMWGCGHSPPPPADAVPSLDGVAASLLAWLDAKDVERFAVMGSSLGGYLAFALWRAAPKRITAMVLAGTRSGADTEERRREREEQARHVLADGSVDDVVDAMVPRLVAADHDNETHLIDPLIGRIRRCTPAGIAWALRAMAARPDSTALLPSIGVPTLVVAGSGDRVIPPEESRALAARIPDATLLEMHRSGHLPNLEEYAAFNEAVGGFLHQALG
jgi:pimeloyl-ACP methyl ester carboxylesterase